MKLKNDRAITISTGESRQSTSWRRQSLSLGDLYDRISRPVRGQERMAVYLKLTKAQQTALKDVGGFVAGALKGPRRKRDAVISRDIVTLDMDSIPAGRAYEVIDRVEALGAGYCMYSTRKHRPEAPRLRALIPLDRSVTPEEYEAVSRKIAEHIGLELMDPSTFEPHRLMYWGSCCADGDWVYKYSDRPLIHADRVLGEYDDWHDRKQWPIVPGEPQPEARKGKLEDPRGKSGPIGAFCRRYSITRAMEEFLPGVYTPAGEDRYSYAGGSTVGGAIVYDDDTFMYSHHATDPAGGQEVNAFDLVRLHRFADLDDEAKQGTPTHRLPSYRAMLDFAMSLPEIAAEVAEEKGRAALEAFEAVPEAGDEQALARFLGGLHRRYVTTAVIEQLLGLTGISLRLNEITWQVDVEGYPREWSRANVEGQLPTMLIDMLRPVGAIGATKQAVCDSLDLIADKNRYNPFAELLRGAQWDGTDRQKELLEILNVTEPLSRKLIHKWLIQTVALAMNSDTRPTGAEGVLVLQGPQGVGKTATFRQISPDFAGGFKEGARLDLRDKDTAMHATRCMICELGELDRTTVKDSAGLKAFITQSMDEFRAPYARKAVRRPRRTSFCGTVNPEDYLVDDSGTRRWWTVSVDESIDLKRLFALDSEWRRQLWAQCYGQWQVEPESFRLSPEERRELEKRNRRNLRALDYELELEELFNWELPREQWGEFTAAQVADRLRLAGVHGASARKLGRVLTKLAGQDERMTVKVWGGRGHFALPLLRTGEI